MSISPIDLLVAMVLVLGLNSALVRFGLAGRYPALYWIVQGMDAAIIVAVLVWGVPGVRGHATVVNWIIAAVVAMHIVQNLSARLAAQSEARRADLDAEWAALQQRVDSKRRDGAAPEQRPSPAEGPAPTGEPPADPGQGQPS